MVNFQHLLQWHQADPPDAFEQNRNDVIYSYQTNRNPFIDHPEWVEELWGASAANGPTIVSAERNITVPDENQDLVVSAVVTDDLSVSSVKLKYQD